VALAPGVVAEVGPYWAAVPLLARGGGIAVVVAQLNQTDEVVITLDAVTATGNTAGGALHSPRAHWSPVVMCTVYHAIRGCYLHSRVCQGLAWDDLVLDWAKAT
jgi:hypothetical protein